MTLKYPCHPNQTIIRSLRTKGHVSPRYSPLYRFGTHVCQVCLSMFGIKTRLFGRHLEPSEGGVVFVSNHQSFLDPPVVGCATKRPMSFMARDSLFKVPPFGRMFRNLNCIPVKRGTADMTAIRESMRRIKSGGMMTIFPEGTRSEDGIIKPFLPGVSMLAQRAADWVVPVCVDGAHEIWPRHQLFPSSGQIVAQFGKPIDARTIRKQPSDEFLADIRERIIQLQHEIRTRLGKPLYRYDE